MNVAHPSQNWRYRNQTHCAHVVLCERLLTSTAPKTKLRPPGKTRARTEEYVSPELTEVLRLCKASLSKQALLPTALDKLLEPARRICNTCALTIEGSWVGLRSRCREGGQVAALRTSRLFDYNLLFWREESSRSLSGLLFIQGFGLGFEDSHGTYGPCQGSELTNRQGPKSMNSGLKSLMAPVKYTSEN